MLDMIIAECRQCGAKRYSWGEEDALRKLGEHVCTPTMPPEKLWQAVNAIIEGKESCFN